MNKKAILAILLCIVLCVVFYINKNISSIYVTRANHYYEQNNIPKAQEYWEKAFKLGVVDTKARNLYVNSIINSPLTIASQEKLLNFLKYPIDDGAKIKIEYFLQDLRREIHSKYPKNYIQQAPFNQQILRWGTMPVTYGFENTNNVPDYFVKEIENAFIQWQSATDNLIYFKRNDKKPNIVIVFKEKDFQENETGKYVVAYTNPVIQTNIFKNAVITFYTKSFENQYFSQVQIYNTALHEIAHALGFMGHSLKRENIMHMSLEAEDQANKIRWKLTNADINTMKLLYTIKPDTTNVDKPDGEYLSTIILGTDDDIIYAKAREAKDYVEKAPHLPSGYIDLAENYVAEKNYNKAIQNLEKALLLADNDDLKYIANYNLAVVYLKINNTDMAIDYAKQAQKLQDTEEIDYIIAEIYSAAGDYKKSIPIYKNLIKTYPNNIEYVICLTNIYIKNKDYMNARKVLKNCFKNNPSEKNNSRFNSYGILKFGL